MQLAGFLVEGGSTGRMFLGTGRILLEGFVRALFLKVFWVQSS